MSCVCSSNPTCTIGNYILVSQVAFQALKDRAASWMPSLCLGEQLSFPSTPCQNLNVSGFIWAKHRFKVVTTWDDQALVWDSVFMGRFTSTLSHTAIRAVKSAMLFTTILSFFYRCLFSPTLRKSCFVAPVALNAHSPAIWLLLWLLLSSSFSAAVHFVLSAGAILY